MMFLMWSDDMVTTLSIRELTRSSNILMDYDYIDIEDRKSHTYKGVFVPDRYAVEVKEFIKEKLLREKQLRKKALLKFSGIAEGNIGKKNFQDLKQEKIDR